ncbi:MAG: hypothetical protein R6X27_20175, partial [Candidatus Desulfacyla sp.]
MGRTPFVLTACNNVPLVVGEHEKFASALISPNIKYFEEIEAHKPPDTRVSGKLIESEEVLSS